MIFQTFIYLISRLSSVLLSFLLFALVGRILTSEDAAKAYFCSFIFGFCLSTTRNCAQIGASIDAKANIKNRLFDVKRGYALMTITVIPLSLIGMFGVYYYTQNIVVSIITSLTIIVSSPNIDLIRGAFNRSSIFPLLFAGGTLLSLICVKFFFPHTLIWVVVAFLVQWFFVAINNFRLISRFFLKINYSLIPIRYILSTIMLAGFDGLIFNIPFFGFLPPSSSSAIEISLAIRIFTASLPLLPLLIHWSNSNHSYKFGFKNIKHVFRIIILFCGFACGVIFILAYIYVANKNVRIEVFGFYMILLISYSYYIPELRYSFVVVANMVIIPIILFIILLLYMTMIIFVTNYYGSYSIFIIALQSTALVLSAFLLHYLGKSKNVPASRL